MRRLLVVLAACLLFSNASGAQTPPEPPRPLANATQIHYDHATSGLNATNVQSAINELRSLIGTGGLVGTGVVPGNFTDFGFTIQSCDDINPSVSTMMQIVGGTHGAYLTFTMFVDAADNMWYRVTTPIGSAGDTPPYSAGWTSSGNPGPETAPTLWPAKVSPAITSVITIGEIIPAQSADAAALPIIPTGGPWTDTIYIPAGRAFQLYSRLPCTTYTVAAHMMEPLE